MRRTIHKWLYPELRRFSTTKQADEAFAHAGRARGNFFLDYMLIPILMVSFMSLDGVIERRLGIGEWASYAIGIGILGATVYVLVRRDREPIRRSLRESLNAHGLPTCINCGYDIAGVHCVNCPECGKPIIDPVES